MVSTPPVAAGWWSGQQHVAHDFPESGGGPLVTVEVRVRLDAVTAGGVGAGGVLAALLHDGGHSSVTAWLGPVVLVGSGGVHIARGNDACRVVHHVGPAVRGPRSTAASLTRALVQIENEFTVIQAAHVVAVVDLFPDQDPRNEIEAMVVDGRVLEAAAAGQFWVPHV